jgi:hypothetical protein
VENKPLSVEVPRTWSQKAVDQGNSLLVSTSTANWKSNPQIEGVFVGLVNGSTLPGSPTAPQGCTAGTPDTSQQQVVTFQYSCNQGPDVVEQYRQVDKTKQVRVQVREADPKLRQTVLNSVNYAPLGD